MGDDFCDHGIVERRDRVAGSHTRINTRIFRRREQCKLASGRQKIPRRVFRIKPRLESPAIYGKFVLTFRQRFTGGYTQLPFDQIKPGDGFRHRMLDL